MAKKKEDFSPGGQITRLKKINKTLSRQLKDEAEHARQLEYQISVQTKSQDEIVNIADKRTTELQEERQKSVALIRSNAELAISVRALQDTIIKAMKSS